jgi:lysozyme
MIAESNQLHGSSILQIGQVIRIPGAQGAGNAFSSAQAAPSSIGGLRYTIQSGDTLLAIAGRYGMSWETLAAANRLTENDLLQIGQILIVPGQAPASGGAATVGFIRASSTGPANATSGNYSVQPGDTLLAIAIRYDMTWETLAAANNLSENALLQIGQTLTIPGQGAASPSSSGFIQNSAPARVARYHTVTSGETVVTIAALYGLNSYDLMRLNGLSQSTALQVGQQIRLE